MLSFIRDLFTVSPLPRMIVSSFLFFLIPCPGRLTLAEKFGQDSYLECKVYAEIGGIPKEELMLLESEFMQSVQHNLYVDGDLFARYDTELRKQTTRMLSKGLL